MRSRRDAGFTLVEVLVVTVILSVIVGVLAQAASVDFKVTDSAPKALASASGSTMLSARLLADIQGATSLGTVAGPACGPTAGRALWTRTQEGTAPVVAVVAAYRVEPAAGGNPSRLIRRPCRDGVEGNPQVLANWPGTDPVQVTCDDRTQCGAQTALTTTLTADGDTVSIASAAGFPTSGPSSYPITVDDEPMTVVGGFGSTTLSVTRPDPVLHAAGPSVIVAYSPTVVTVRVPGTGSAAFTAATGPSDSPYSISVARRPA